MYAASFLRGVCGVKAFAIGFFSAYLIHRFLMCLRCFPFCLSNSVIIIGQFIEVTCVIHIFKASDGIEAYTSTQLSLEQTTKITQFSLMFNTMNNGRNTGDFMKKVLTATCALMDR